MIRNDFMLRREKWVIISYFSNVLFLTDSILFIKILKNIDRVFFQIKHFLIVILNDILIVYSRQFIPYGESWWSLSLLFYSIQIVSENLSLCLDIFYRPHNRKCLNLRVKFIIRCIKERNKFYVGVIRMWNHWSNLIVYVPCWWLIKLFTTG